MLTLIIIWMICVQLAMPTWCFVILGIAIFTRLLGGIINFIKLIAALAKYGEKDK